MAFRVGAQDPEWFKGWLESEPADPEEGQDEPEEENEPMVQPGKIMPVVMGPTMTDQEADAVAMELLRMVD